MLRYCSSISRYGRMCPYKANSVFVLNKTTHQWEVFLDKFNPVYCRIHADSYARKLNKEIK